uniref:Uncharacterized protein n=1 Tax=Rhizophora mucronata TaxID=61149 RepID=A0A2P2JV38_RHIMU
MWLGLFRLYPCWAVPFFVTSRLPHLLGSRFLLKLVKMGSVWIYEPLRYNISICVEAFVKKMMLREVNYILKD